MGLLAGFIGGAGAGLADVAKTSYKDMLDNQKVEKQNAFDLERDQIESERKRAAFKEGIMLQRNLETQYGKEDMTAVTTAINQAGGDLNKAMSLAPTTAQQKIIMEMMKATTEQDVGKANINQSNASADASRTHANYYDLMGQDKQLEINSQKNENELVKTYNNPNTPPEERARIEQYFNMKRRGGGTDGSKELSENQKLNALQKLMEQEATVPPDKSNVEGYNRIRAILGEPLWIPERDPKTGEIVFAVEKKQAAGVGGVAAHLEALGEAPNPAKKDGEKEGKTPALPPSLGGNQIQGLVDTTSGAASYTGGLISDAGKGTWNTMKKIGAADQTIMPIQTEADMRVEFLMRDDRYPIEQKIEALRKAGYSEDRIRKIREKYAK